MTIKKRLAVSNVLMILGPVLITAVMALLIFSVVYFFFDSQANLRVEEGREFSTDYVRYSQKISKYLEENESIEIKKEKLNEFAESKNIFLEIFLDGSSVLTVGNDKAKSEHLKKISEKAGGDIFISDTGYQLCRFTLPLSGKVYDVFMFNKKADITITRFYYEMTNLIYLISFILIAAVIVISIVITNNFSTKFVFRKITEPLKILSDGVDEIGKGNLDFRIKYDNDDEFRPVCDAFNQMALRLKESVEFHQKDEESRKELMLDISHDLRSPLTSVQAYIDGLLEGVASTPEMQIKYLKTIKRKATDMENMINALFDYSKIGMDNLNLNITPIDITGFFREYLAAVSEEFSSKGMTIRFESDGTIFAAADKSLLGRVIINLLDNSLKYCKNPDATVTVSIKETENTAVITFSDNGPGVDEKSIDRIFDVFYRSDDARSDTGSGSGIGLGIVKKAVEIMGGKVYAENNAERGLSVITELVKKNG